MQSVAACPGSDLVASGAGDGAVRLWRIGDAGDERPDGSGGIAKARHLVPLEEAAPLAVPGFVNALAFSRDARMLVVGTGQEPRLGRWGCDASAASGVQFHRL